jgi:predicted metalloprotease
MRLPIPTGGGGRIGLGTVVVVVLFLVLQTCQGNSLIPGTGDGSGSNAVADDCKTGEDANRDQSCAIDLITNSVQNYWAQTLPAQQGSQYADIKTVKFSGSTDSGCGRASSAMGPFYCPNDQRVYLDTSFMDDMLTGQLGAEGGPFALAYVIAHEYGHHVQHLVGTDRRVGNDRQGETSGSVRLELQADCYAGVWAAHAVDTGFIEQLTADDIADGLDAAAAVGDDRIQERATGRVDRESWTHGSAAARQRWFDTGYRGGDPERCDTFAVGAL